MTRRGPFRRLPEGEDWKDHATPSSYSPIEVATALSLYGYNVSPQVRAQKLYDHFKGDCANLVDLVAYMNIYGSAATALAYPTALVYLQHALDKYGEEAVQRVHINHQASLDIIERYKIATQGE